jgi:hypothetical protein
MVVTLVVGLGAALENGRASADAGPSRAAPKAVAVTPAAPPIKARREGGFSSSRTAESECTSHASVSSSYHLQMLLGSQPFDNANPLIRRVVCRLFRLRLAGPVDGCGNLLVFPHRPMMSAHNHRGHCAPYHGLDEDKVRRSSAAIDGRALPGGRPIRLRRLSSCQRRTDDNDRLSPPVCGAAPRWCLGSITAR